jgi:hypothetical protein
LLAGAFEVVKLYAMSMWLRAIVMKGLSGSSEYCGASLSFGASHDEEPGRNLVATAVEHVEMADEMLQKL